MVIEINCWLANAAINKSRCIEGRFRSEEVKPGTGRKPGGLIENHGRVTMKKQRHSARPPFFHPL